MSQGLSVSSVDGTALQVPVGGVVVDQGAVQIKDGGLILDDDDVTVSSGKLAISNDVDETSVSIINAEPKLTTDQLVLDLSAVDDDNYRTRYMALRITTSQDVLRIHGDGRVSIFPSYDEESDYANVEQAALTIERGGATIMDDALHVQHGQNESAALVVSQSNSDGGKFEAMQIIRTTRAKGDEFTFFAIISDYDPGTICNNADAYTNTPSS